MKRLHDHLREWFGFTRRERRAAIILLFIIIVAAAARYTVPDPPLPIDTAIEEEGQSAGRFNFNQENQEPDPENNVNQYLLRAQSTQKERKSVQRLDLNSCDSASLEALPGIGPVLSARIIRYRNLLGGYASVSQLKEVYGLSQETFDLVRDRVVADSMAVRKIRINQAEYRELLRFPYLEKHEVNAILKYRELEGRITDIGDLISNRIIESSRAARIRPYLEFGDD